MDDNILYRINHYDKRTRRSLNEILVYETYAEIILYDKYQNEKARAVIDVDDIERVKNYKWSLDRYVKCSSKSILLHRFITKCDDPNVVIDHINVNPLDNRKSNLRFCDTSKNAMNQGISSRNKSGHKGVFLDKHRNKWRATISINKKPIMIGRFDTLEEALEARKLAEEKYYQEFSYKGGGK